MFLNICLNLLFIYLTLREWWNDFIFFLKEEYFLKIDYMDKEEAALFILEREVSFKWSPQIVEQQKKSNIIHFDEIKKKMGKKNA